MDAVRDLSTAPLTAEPAPPTGAVEGVGAFGEDLQLALHHQGFAGVHPGWESWARGAPGAPRCAPYRGSPCRPVRTVRTVRTGKVHLRRLEQRVAAASRPPSRPEQGGRAMRSAPLGTVGTARRAAAGATVR